MRFLRSKSLGKLCRFFFGDATKQTVLHLTTLQYMVKNLSLPTWSMTETRFLVYARD